MRHCPRSFDKAQCFVDFNEDPFFPFYLQIRIKELEDALEQERQGRLRVCPFPFHVQLVRILRKLIPCQSLMCQDIVRGEDRLAVPQDENNTRI